MKTSSTVSAGWPRSVALVAVTFAGLLAIAGCQKRGSGVEMSEERRFEAIHGLKFGGAAVIDVHVRAGAPATLLQVTGDDDVVPKIVTEVHDGVLAIRDDSKRSPNLPLELSLTVASLDAIDLSGAVRGTIEGLQARAFRLHVSGAADLRVSGRCAALDVDVSGAAKVDAGELLADDAKVQLSGAGRIDVRTTGKLDVAVSGAGTVRYTGPPTSITKQVSGVGSVEPR